MAKLISNNGREFEFEGLAGRRYRVPFGRNLTKRNVHARGGGMLTIVRDDGQGTPKAKWGTKPKSWLELDSLEKDYDLSPFAIEGKPLHPEPVPRPVSEPPPYMAPEQKPAAAIVVQAQIAGLPLEVVEGEWVTLRSLFEPFGKEVEKQLDRLSSWAILQKSLVRPRSGATDPRAKEVWTIHRTHVAQAVAELDPRGMSDHVRAAFVAFKRECASALDAYFTQGVAVNPRIAAEPDWARGLFTRASQRVEEVAGDVARVDAKVDALAASVEELRAQPVELPRPPHGRRVRQNGVDVYGGPVPGSMSQRAAAGSQGLPETGVGARHWAMLARAAGALKDDQAVVLDQRHRLDGRRFMPKALEYTELASSTYLARLKQLGFDVRNGLVVAARATGISATSATAKALEAALATLGAGPQGTIPGIA